MDSVTLQWKEFSIDVLRVRDYLKENLSSNYDGLVCDQESLRVCFHDTITTEDSTALMAYWDSITEETFAHPKPLTMDETVRLNMAFGQLLIAEFSAEPEVNALDSEGTAGLINLLAPVQLMLMTGAVGTAYMFIQSLDFTGILSSELMTKYTNKMATFLGV